MKQLPILLSVLLSLSTMASEYVVVTSTESPITTLEKRAIRDIFLKKRRYVNEQIIVPVNIIGEHPSRHAFEQHILQMSRDELNEYWISNHFQGLTPPATQASNLSLKLFVQRVRGAVGYIPKDLVDENVKVVYEF